MRCTACDYAANTEAVRVPLAARAPSTTARRAGRVDTPGHADDRRRSSTTSTTTGCAAPSATWIAADTMKNVIVMLRHPDGTAEPLAIGVPGDREVDIKRLEAQVGPAEVEPFDDEPTSPATRRSSRATSARARSARAGTSGIRYLVDPRIVEGTRWVTGANEPGQHVDRPQVRPRLHRRRRRSRPPRSAPATRARTAAASSRSPAASRSGHIFQLGRKYAEALGLTGAGRGGKLVTVTMGSYGIGVSRAVAAHRRDHPRRARAVLAARGRARRRPSRDRRQGGRSAAAAAEALAAELEAADLRVLFDDREGVSPGVKFKDAELIGVPTIIVVGRGIDDGIVEVKDRRPANASTCRSPTSSPTSSRWSRTRGTPARRRWRARRCRWRPGRRSPGGSCR